MNLKPIVLIVNGGRHVWTNKYLSDTDDYKSEAEEGPSPEGIAKIAAMFESEEEVVELNTPPTDTGGFMDEESARNYQRIMDKRRKKEPNTTPTKRHIQLLSSEDEDVLDKSKILDNRLRNQQSQERKRKSKMSRLERARQKMAKRSYGSSSSSSSSSSFSEGDISSDDLPSDPLAPSTSAPRKKNRNRIIHSRGSSNNDDSDFVTDPEETPKMLKSRIVPPVGTQTHVMTAPKLNSYKSQRPPIRLIKPPPPQPPLPRRKSQVKRQRKIKGYEEGLDEDLEDFIVDDDEANVSETDNRQLFTGSQYLDSDLDNGIPFSTSTSTRPFSLMAMLPNQFSLYDLPTSFKIYIQYLIYWLGNRRQVPVGVKKNLDYFYSAYQAVARQVDALEESVVASSAWLAEFSRALYKYPEYSTRRISAVPGCEACHFRMRRMATFCITFQGDPYDRRMFDPKNAVANSSRKKKPESDDDDDIIAIYGGSDSESSSGEEENVDFNMGNSCKARATKCHRLHHYFYHLADQLETNLGVLELDMRKQRVNMIRGWRSADPAKVTEFMDRTGETKKLYHQFQGMLADAKIGLTER